jgi:hypothetical protein
VAGSLALAAAVLVAIVLSVGNRDLPDDRMIVEKPPTGIEIHSLKASPEELAQLNSQLDQVAADLDRLAQQAELLDARRAVSELAALYRPLGAEDPS